MGCFDKIKKHRKESTGNSEYTKKVFGMACTGTCCSLFELVLYFVIAIPHIVLGAIHLNECAIQSMIPIYMLVCGVFHLIKLFNKLMYYCQKKKNDGSHKCWEFFIPVINVFMFAWLITGLVMVLTSHRNMNFDETTSPMYCAELCYLSAYYLVFAGLGYVGVYVVASVGLCGLMFCAARAAHTD